MLGVRPGSHLRSRDVALRNRVSDVLVHPRPPLVQLARVLSRKQGQLRVTRLDDIKQAPVDRPQHRVAAQSGDFGVELQRLAAERARLFEVAEETVIQQAAGESLPGDTG